MSDRARLLAAAYRLDLTVNPYGASPRVYDAIAAQDDLHLPSPERTAELRRRIGAMHALPPGRIALAGGIAPLLLAALALAEEDVLLFPPTDPAQERTAALLRRNVMLVRRSHRYAVELDAALPPGSERALALVASPNDPTGTVLSVPEAVRLSRAVRLLVVDERHAAYSPRTLIPLVGEFDSVMVLRTFETWAGLTGFPVAYAVAPPAWIDRLEASLAGHEPAHAAVVAALATLDDLAGVNATVIRVRDEKSRLIRMLRKLNMVRPYPSWANFVLTGVERGDRDFFARRLEADGIVLHLPEQPGLDRHLRVSATVPEATMALKNGLIAAAALL